MTRSEINPYASPTADSLPETPRAPNGSFALAAVAGAGALAFIGFTLLLLQSSEGDRKGGLLFLLNVPVIVAVALSALLSRRAAMYLSLAAAFVQAVITVAMLVMEIGDAAIVIGINTLIVLPCLVVAAWAWLTNRADSEQVRSS